MGVLGLKRFFGARASSGYDIQQSMAAFSHPGGFGVHAPSIVEEAALETAGSAETPVSRSIVRIAVYDSRTAPPRIEEVFGDTPHELIERLSARVYQVARDTGGAVPYTVIRELTENLVHAGFRDVVVSVLDEGRLVRFSDAGPGIRDVDRALRPGFSTATAEMRRYIKGVGSGLPIAAECMGFEGGSIQIEMNLSGGAVVTAHGPHEKADPPAVEPEVFGSASDTGSDVAVVASRLRVDDGADSDEPPGIPVPKPAPSAHKLTDRQKRTLLLVMEVGAIGPSGVSRELSVALSTAHRDLAFLEAEGFIRANATGKRALTPLGVTYIEGLF